MMILKDLQRVFGSKTVDITAKSDVLSDNLFCTGHHKTKILSEQCLSDGIVICDKVNLLLFFNILVVFAFNYCSLIRFFASGDVFIVDRRFLMPESDAQ